MYRKSAALYDLIYRDRKDYRTEAKQLDALLRLLEPAPRRLLDVGCGTGEHALRLARDFGYQVDGIDIEPDFVEIAARKLPEAEFSVADMRRFSLPGRYDAALCLFSSIGYVETETGLRDAFACIARHLKRGGWLVCEPWVRPEEWKPGRVDVAQVVDPGSGVEVTRTRLGETDGAVSVLRIDYDLRHPDGREETLCETHRLGLFTEEQMTSAATGAGFAPRWSEGGVRGAPLLLAVYTP